VRGKRRFGNRPRRQADEAQAIDPQAARLAAFALLARRDFSVAELESQLKERGYAADAIQQAVEGLTAERLLDDARYVENYVHAHAQRGQGPRRIRQDLLAVGLDEPLVEAALKAGPDWAALARDLRLRKFGPELPADWPERARQMRFLQYRGFSNDHIRSALGSSGADEPFDTDP
jgi:regulatory protein